jgi:hypothetical protein
MRWRSGPARWSPVHTPNDGFNDAALPLGVRYLVALTQRELGGVGAASGRGASRSRARTRRRALVIHLGFTTSLESCRDHIPAFTDRER